MPEEALYFSSIHVWMIWSLATVCKTTSGGSAVPARLHVILTWLLEIQTSSSAAVVQEQAAAAAAAAGVAMGRGARHERVNRERERELRRKRVNNKHEQSSSKKSSSRKSKKAVVASTSSREELKAEQRGNCSGGERHRGEQ